MLELKMITLSVKTRIIAPAHPSATGFGRVSVLVKLGLGVGLRLGLGLGMVLGLGLGTD